MNGVSKKRIKRLDLFNEALHAALSRLRELERTQPTKRSGGQRKRGLQDRVYIKSPTGELKRIIPNEKQ